MAIEDACGFENPFKALHPHTLNLHSSEVPEFMPEVAEKTELSEQATTVCQETISEMFYLYGGFYEAPLKPGAPIRSYHNGSHAASSCAVSAFLAHSGLESQDVRDACAIAGACHDYYRGSPAHGEDEEMSAFKAREKLEKFDLGHLAELVTDGIRGTIIEQRGRTIIQRAKQMDSPVAKIVADADLANLVSDKVVEWSLRLALEERSIKNEATARADTISAFVEEKTVVLSGLLKNTLQLEETHEFLSDMGKLFFQPLLPEKLAELKKICQFKKLSDYF